MLNVFYSWVLILSLASFIFLLQDHSNDWSQARKGRPQSFAKVNYDTPKNCLEFHNN
jgi:hypothetical protein